MADDDLLALYWTVSGPVEVHVGREWSLFDFADRCAQARRVGYAGVGIWHADLEHLLETRKLRELAQIVADNGLRYLELEFIMDWFLDPGDERRVESDRVRRMLFEAAAALPVHHIKVGNIPGTPAPIAQVTERFGELCADAAEHHDAAIVYEFMPFDVNVNTLEAAVAVVEGAGAPNGGIAFDTWHMGKLGIAPEDLRRVPVDRVTWIELSDGRRENMPDLIDETVNHRLLPGEGEFEPARYVEVARELGYSGPWGVEVLSEDLRNLPIEEIFQRSYDTSMSQLRAGVA